MSTLQPTERFKRGGTYSRVVTIPDDYADGYFVGWLPASEARQRGQPVCTFECAWVDPATTRQIRLQCIDTTGWPLGDVDMDVLLVRTSDRWVSPTTTHTFIVVDGQTHVPPPTP